MSIIAELNVVANRLLGAISLAARWFGGEMTVDLAIVDMCEHGVSLPMNLH